MGMSYYRRATLAFALLFVLFPGCKSADRPAQSNTKAARLFAVSVDSAAFFRHGPQQGRVPDLKLPKDTIVKLPEHRLFVTEENFAIFGESTHKGVITQNCYESIRKTDIELPARFRRSSGRYVIMGKL